MIDLLVGGAQTLAQRWFNIAFLNSTGDALDGAYSGGNEVRNRLCFVNEVPSSCIGPFATARQLFRQ